MKWIQRHRQSERSKLPRIAISEQEILDDLEYPAPRRAARRGKAVPQARRA